MWRNIFFVGNLNRKTKEILQGMITLNPHFKEADSHIFESPLKAYLINHKKV